MKATMRSFLLIALFAFSAVVGVVGQCTYDPSPARDFANGRVIKYDTSDKNPGGAHGPGGRSLKGGFCIDAKDNAQKCQGQAAEVVGLYECSNGQLCCPETYRNSMPLPTGKHAPGTCGLNKKDKSGRFMIGKCASDKWGTCDQVGAIEALDAMDNCGPGMRQCCEYLKGEFEAEQSKIRAAAAERRAAEQAAAAKAAAEQKAAAQQAAAAEAARQKAADDAAVAAARSRAPEAPVGCNFASNGGRSFYQGTCVRSKVECPGGLADPNNMSAGSSTCTSKFGSGAVCCKNGARLGGAEEAENKVVKDREAAETKAQMDKWRAEQETRASVKSNLEKAEDEARQIASRAGGGAIACVGWKNAGANAVPGTCVASASACPSGNYVTSGSITDYAITCGKLAAGGGQPVCCGGGGAATPPVKVGASAPPSAAAPSPAAAASAAAAPSSPSSSSSSSSGSSSCTYNRGGRSVSGYCAPASWLCPSETNYGSSTSCQGSSVCCGPAPTSSGDLAQTVCPIPSYSSSSAFVEEEIHIQPTPRFSRRRLALQATPKTKSAKSKSKTKANDKFTHCLDAKTKKVRTCAKNETPNAVDPKVTAAAAKKIADAKKAAATKKAKATADKKAAQQKAAQAKKANAAKQKKANAGKKAGQQKKSAANKSKKDNAGKKAKTSPKKKTNSPKSNKSANSKSNKNGANKKSKDGLPKNANAKAKAPSKAKTKKANTKKAASNKSKKDPASKKKLNSKSAKSSKKDAKSKGTNKKKTGKSTTDKSKNKTKTDKSKNKTKTDKKVGAKNMKKGSTDKTKAKKSGKKAGTNKGKDKSSTKNGKSSKKAKNNSKSKSKKTNDKSKAGSSKQTPLKQCAKGAAGKACREENKKISAANKAAKAAGGDPKKTSADAKKSDANAKETSAASAGDPTKLTPKQKAHCNAERRAWLASKARKGDQKAIAQLKKESKKKFFY